MKSIKGVLAVFTLMTIACLSAPEARSWGRLGHATVAKIAYDHLTPKAKKAILEYVGAPLPAILDHGLGIRAVKSGICEEIPQ